MYKEPFIPHIWATVETLSFTSLSKWFKATCSKEVKKEVFHKMGFKNIETLEGTLHALTPIRNVCAHHGRLWNRRFIMRFPVINKLKGTLQINQNSEGTDMLIYNALVILSYMVSIVNPKSKWTKRLYNLINDLPEKRLKSMGFPKDWIKKDHWSNLLSDKSN